jgi:hypothetical protein
MRPIKYDSSSPENTQGWHYMPKSATRATEALDPTHAASCEITKTDPKLRKLG